PREGNRGRHLPGSRRGAPRPFREGLRRERHGRDLVRRRGVLPCGRAGSRAGGARREDLLGLGDPLADLGPRARSPRYSGGRERRRTFGSRRSPGPRARSDGRRDRGRDAPGRRHRLSRDPQGARVPGARTQGRHVPHGVENGRRPPEDPLPPDRREPPVAPSVALPTPEEIHRAKLAGMRSGGAGGPLPSNVDWIASLPASERARYDGSVRRKPSRTLSGVAVVAVMTAPARCPHGRCTYCPGGLENGSPQSYTGEEPSALRGAQFHWDARAIARHRIETLEAIGHPTSKVEVIVMGGTFPSRPRSYQEVALHRVVGLTVETRPDWCDERVLPFLLEAGVTRVEVGVECLHDDVLEAV